ncbi:MAG: HAD-IC family P-type ATPase [bacterium]|nr:HAD-IC family P-type ATPase [bacterium]
MNISEKFRGLSDAEVEQRVARGAVNRTEQRSSRSIAEILQSNIFTRFNAILGVLLAIIIFVGSLKDALFGIVLVLNAAIGIVQELRAKWTLDRLFLLNASDVTVIRNGRKVAIHSDEVVADDAVVISEGEQIVADGEVLATAGLEIDESLLTGEAEAVLKKEGDRLLSGSFVIAGRGVYKATEIGENAYANKLAKEARQFKVPHSELQSSINTILRFVTWVMVPAALLLFLTERSISHSIDAAAISTVSGLVGMIPQGLVLLTSMAFAVSVIRLGKRNVLVQELPAVESLARVDVVCFDKTGTLTEGPLAFDRLEILDESQPAKDALGALAEVFAESSDSMLATIALANPSPKWTAQSNIPFSPLRRWSAAIFEEHGTWVLGAPEVLLERIDQPDEVRMTFTHIAESGARVLLLAATDKEITAESLPSLKAIAFVLIREHVRDDAPEILSFFKAQGVQMKVISGDNLLTVSAVARQAGLDNASQSIDARTMPEDSEALGLFMENNTVFGRVQPQQKKAMVRALQERGHVVAMLGDGVNDVLAIKQADLGIAVGSGAPATKAVAQLVLIDGRFETLPHIVAEGRRVLANVERVANLFVTKTVYATLLVIVVSLARWPFLLLPRHFTLIDAFTIGTPAFFLALAPNIRRYQPGFLSRLLSFTLPAGVILGVAVLVSILLARLDPSLTLEQEQTLAMIVLSLLGLRILMVLATPFLSWRGVLVAVMTVGFFSAFLIPYTRTFFALTIPSQNVLLETGVVVIVALALLQIVWRLVQAHGSSAKGAIPAVL